MLTSPNEILEMADSDSPSPAAADAEVSATGSYQSGRSSTASLLADSVSLAPDSPTEFRQVLSELLSGNAVIPSKNRVKCDVAPRCFSHIKRIAGTASSRLRSNHRKASRAVVSNGRCPSARFNNRMPAHEFISYVEITKDNVGQGGGAVIRYFVCGTDGRKSTAATAAALPGDISTSELDLVGSAVLYGSSVGPTKNPRGSFKHCIRIDFSKDFQPASKSSDEAADRESLEAKSVRFSHQTPQKLVLCLSSEAEKREWLQALTDAMRMTDQEAAATSVLLASLSRSSSKQFEQAVAKLVSSEPPDERIRALLADILTQLMGPNAISQTPQLVREGLNCIGTLVERMPLKMRDRKALNMFVPPTITQTDSSSPIVSQAAFELLATAVRCCKEHILPFFYGIFQAILRHIDSNVKERRLKVNNLNDALMQLAGIKNAKEVWQKTLDKHLELIITADCDSDKEHSWSSITASQVQREKRQLELQQMGTTKDASGAQDILTAAEASKIMLVLKFQWLELLIDKSKLDCIELGVSTILPQAVVTLLDAACHEELHQRALSAVQVVKSLYCDNFSKRSFSSIGVTDSALAQVLVSKTSADRPLPARNVSFLLVSSFLGMHRAAALPYIASFIKNVIMTMPYSENVPNVRIVHEQMQKLIRGPPLLGDDSCADLVALIHAVTSLLDTCSHSECSDTLQWIQLFNELYPGIFLGCMGTFLPPFMRLLVNCDGLSRLSGPVSPSTLMVDGELRGCVPIAIELFASLARQRGSCSELVRELVECLAQLKPESMLQTTREVVGNLSSGNETNTNSLRPLELFTQLCMQLQRHDLDQHFCHLMSHILVNLLFVKPELGSLRALLGNVGASAASAEFFGTCFRGFSSNPVALIALCFYSRIYSLAAVVIRSFAELELSHSFEIEVQYVVRLLQGPTMQLVRYDLHGGSGHECRSQAWRALNALLAIMCDLPPICIA